MSRLDRNGGDHRQTWDLIPWVVNGRASSEECQLVETHVAHCHDCSRELEFQRSLQVALAEPVETLLDPQASFRKLQGRLQEDGETGAAAPQLAMRAQRHRPGRLRRWRLRTQGLVAAVVIEAVALAAIGNAWWLQARTQHADAQYHVLSAGPAPVPGATIRAVLSPAVTVGELQSLLIAANLQIVAGPSEAGAYSLGPRAVSNPVSRQAVLERLRSNPQVRFAEPIGDSVK